MQFGLLSIANLNRALATCECAISPTYEQNRTELARECFLNKTIDKKNEGGVKSEGEGGTVRDVMLSERRV